VPDALRERLGKKEIVKQLGSSEKEALSSYPSFHAKIEQIFSGLNQPLAGEEETDTQNMSELEAHVQLIKKLRELGFDPYHQKFNSEGHPSDEAYKGKVAEGILDGYPVNENTGDPVGLSEEDAALVRALYSGPRETPAPTLADAKNLYLQEKESAGIEAADYKKLRQRAERVIGHAIDAIGGDRRITDVRRADARLIRDYLKGDIDVKLSTAKR